METRLAHNLAACRARIAAAALRAGRSADDVTLVAVSKYAEWPWVQAAWELGLRDFGEARPQQLWDRAAQLPADVRWHLIGPLQRNKARRTITSAHLIHSVESLRLLETLERLAIETAVRPRVLLELNLIRDQAKHGFSAEQLRAEWAQVLQCTHVELAGLMTMAAYSPASEDSRPVFRQLRDLRDALQRASPDTIHLRELSMGMTGDFEVAIEEGATLVRIGTALWNGLGEPMPAAAELPA